MNRMRLLATLIVAIFILTLSACQRGSDGGGKIKVAFVSNNPATFWTIAEAGCRKAEAETGVELIFRRPERNDPALQKRILDDLMILSVKAIAVSVINPQGQRRDLDEIAARIPLITQDNDAPESKRLCYIGTNNYVAGRAVGQLVKEVLPAGGTIAVFVGQLDALNARQRRQGLLDELADQAAPTNIADFELAKDGATYGKFRLHRTYTDDAVEQKSQQNATDALTQLGDEKALCFIGLWAYNPPAILTAVKDQGRVGQVKIVGFDEDPTTLKGIADGHIHGTVVQDPFNFGYESVKLMAALAQGDRSALPKETIRYVPHRVITKDGGPGRMPVEKFLAEMDAMLRK